MARHRRHRKRVQSVVSLRTVLTLVPGPGARWRHRPAATDPPLSDLLTLRTDQAPPPPHPQGWPFASDYARWIAVVRQIGNAQDVDPPVGYLRHDPPGRATARCRGRQLWVVPRRKRSCHIAAGTLSSPSSRRVQALGAERNTSAPVSARFGSSGRPLLSTVLRLKQVSSLVAYGRRSADIVLRIASASSA